MKSEFLSMHISSAVVKANKILNEHNEYLKIFARINEKYLPIFDINELEEHLRETEKYPIVFNESTVAKAVYWLDIIDETHAEIRGVYFNDRIEEIGSSVIYKAKSVDDFDNI